MYQETRRALQRLREHAKREGWTQQRLKSLSGIIKATEPKSAQAAVDALTRQGRSHE